MQLGIFDGLIIVMFFACVIALGLAKSRKEVTSEDYFLAGRGLKWWLIGFSLIAANISAEQFVGMAGQAASPGIGLAVASYEWLAAITLVVVAFFFLPKFLKSGIFTIPEYLEYRFNHSARLAMSALMVIVFAGVTIPTVIYLGARTLGPLFPETVLGIPVTIATLSWFVGILAALYVAAGGLRAVAWADLIQGSALIVGGAIIMVLAFMALDNPGAYEGVDKGFVYRSLGVEQGATLGEKFAVLKDEQMSMILPRESTFLPWTALLLGIWIPNFYYWGLNQFIMQRTLGAHSLREGQRGVVFAAFLKLLIPFIVCVPGIIAFTLYAPMMHENAMQMPGLNRPALETFAELKDSPEDSDMIFRFNADFAQIQPELSDEIIQFNAAVLGLDVPDGDDLAQANHLLVEYARQERPDIRRSRQLVGYDYDGAFPLLIRYLTPVGLRGFVLAALMGAVISSLASMLNAGSTIFTMDLYKDWFTSKESVNHKLLILIGRICVGVLVVIGCLIAPLLADPRFGGAFAFIQEFQGFISPGILVIFLFGLFIKKAPRMCGLLGLILSPVIYGVLFFFWSDLAFLNRMALTVGIITAVLAVVTVMRPLPAPVTLPEQTRIEMEWSKGSMYLGGVVIAATIALYIIFW